MNKAYQAGLPLDKLWVVIGGYVQDSGSNPKYERILTHSEEEFLIEQTRWTEMLTEMRKNNPEAHSSYYTLTHMFEQRQIAAKAVGYGNRVEPVDSQIKMIKLQDENVHREMIERERRMSHQHLISKTCYGACAISWIFVALFHLSLIVYYHISGGCSEALQYAQHDQIFTMVPFSVFISLWISMIMRYRLCAKDCLLGGSRRHLDIVFVALNVLTISILHIGISLATNYGGVLTNALGASTHMMMWPEWITTVPLMVYLVVVLVDAPKLSTVDMVYIAVNCSSMVLAALTNFDLPPWVCWVLIVLSCILYVPNFFLPALLLRDCFVVNDTSLHDITDQRKIHALHMTRRYHSACWLTCGSLLFPIIYFISIAGFINAATSIGCYHLASMIVKGQFASTVVESYIVTDLRTMLGEFNTALVEERWANKATGLVLDFFRAK